MQSSSSHRAPVWLHQPAHVDVPPKVASLMRAMAGHLAVPQGVFVRDAVRTDRGVVTARDASVRDVIGRLLEAGPLIVRSAAVDEGTAGNADSGRERSFPGVASADATLEALAALSGRALLQRYVPGELCVAAYQPGASPVRRAWVERWARAQGSSLPLAESRTPDASALLGQIDEAPLRRALTSMLVSVAALPGLPHTVELEMVWDASAGQLWLVQLRHAHPLSAAPFARFERELERRGQRLPSGTWHLDAEHNPHPLSPAHIGLVEDLAGGEHADRVLAGWLYRSADASKRRAAQRERAHANYGSAVLTDVLPRMIARSEGIDRTIAERDWLGAWQRTLEALQICAEALALALARGAASMRADDVPRDARSVLGRFGSVLPCRWDIAAPTLAQVQAVHGGRASAASGPRALDSLGASRREHARGPAARDVDRDPSSLGFEWDDVPFAWVMHRARRIYLELARVEEAALGPLGASLVARGERAPWGPWIFGFSLSELLEVCRTPADPRWPKLLEQREADMVRAQSLFAPVVIEDGRAMRSHASAPMAGIPIGRSCRGRWCWRDDLEALLLRPPRRGDVVGMPAVTAQAVSVLAQHPIAGFCSQHGGALSHACAVARELGLSALVGVGGAHRVPLDAVVSIDAQLGRLRVVGRSAHRA